MSGVRKAGGRVISAAEVTGRTWSQIRDLAEVKGLVPKGDAANPDYPRKWEDPVTGNTRLRLDRGHVDRETQQPYKNPSAAADHVQVYDENGAKVRVDGDPHIPTIGD